MTTNIKRLMRRTILVCGSSLLLCWAMGCNENQKQQPANLHGEEFYKPTEVPATVKFVGSSRVDLQACKLEYSIVSPK